MHRKRNAILKQIGLQIFLLLITASVLFPILWIFSMALDSRNIDKPLELTLIPPGASLAAFKRVLFEPFSQLCKNPQDTSTCMFFGKLLANSLLVALGTSVFAVVLGSSAAYAFSRFKFIGRQAGMLGFIVLLMLPSTATLAPLYVLLSLVKIGGEPLRHVLNGALVVGKGEVHDLVTPRPSPVILGLDPRIGGGSVCASA